MGQKVVYMGGNPKKRMGPAFTKPIFPGTKEAEERGQPHRSKYVTFF
tara:strand:+ start:664 stop:804 length:141 start_codon:yes stop_codon:yes gene_type:complete